MSKQWQYDFIEKLDSTRISNEEKVRVIDDFIDTMHPLSCYPEALGDYKRKLQKVDRNGFLEKYPFMQSIFEV